MINVDMIHAFVEEATELILLGSISSDPQFYGWYKKVDYFLIKTYGINSRTVAEFREIRFHSEFDCSRIDEDLRLKREACACGLYQAVAFLSVYLEDNDVISSSRSVPNTINIPDKSQESSTKAKAFIVHGHNGEMKEAVARLIERQGIKAIILHEQANKGKTIIEKFEQHSDVGSAICLFTADDLGRAKSESNDSKRARQNVVFEAGYFIGKLGRNNVVIIADPAVEIPSDMQGIVYTDSANWKFSVLQELRVIGYDIDYNKLD